MLCSHCSSVFCISRLDFLTPQGGCLLPLFQLLHTIIYQHRRTGAVVPLSAFVRVHAAACQRGASTFTGGISLSTTATSIAVTRLPFGLDIPCRRAEHLVADGHATTLSVQQGGAGGFHARAYCGGTTPPLASSRHGLLATWKGRGRGDKTPRRRGMAWAPASFSPSGGMPATLPAAGIFSNHSLSEEQRDRLRVAMCRRA